MIALIFCGDLKYCPYINRYIERLEKIKTEYKVYFWNRSGFDMSGLSDRYIFFEENSAISNGKIKKLIDFVKFRNWLKKQLKKNQHEKIIVLSTLTGVFLGSYLYNKKYKYIFDIRDYSYEHIAPFFHIEKRVIENSTFTTISSAGFKSFLPTHEYVIAHNFNRNDIVQGVCFKKSKNTINFVWNGVVRYFDFQKAYLDALKNDSRFNIIFHGDGPELSLFKNYCTNNGFLNASFTGVYDNRDKAELLRNADILNNCYGNTQGNGNRVRFAVSNRFYDGIVYHIPQLVEPEGFKTEWVNTAGIGISIPPDKEFADRLYEYYQSIDSVVFDRACERELERVIREDNEYVKMIDKFITM